MIDHTETFKTMGFCPTCERYTAHVCAKCQPAPTPDPQAEIARLTAERDALARELSVANDAAMEGDMFKFAVRDVVRGINRTITEDFYAAIDDIEALFSKAEPGA